MIDSHCHLDSCEPPDADLVERARTAGVSWIATVGMDPASIARAIEAAEAHEGVVAIVGRHPHNAEGFDDSSLEEIEQAASSSDRVRAIGETGLDYFRDNAPREDQRRAFEAQLGLAAKLALPIAIHTRAAEEDTFAMLAERAAELTVILHCFSAPDRLEEAVEAGYLCSFAGNVTYPKNLELQRAASEVPADLLLVETDSPYLSPQPLRGKPNEPANVVKTAEHVARLRGVSYERLEYTVEANAARVFGL